MRMRGGGCYLAGSIVAAVISTIFLSSPVKAGEAYVGVYQHDADFWRNAFEIIGTDPKEYEGGIDYEIGWRSEPVEALSFLHRPRIYALAHLNDSGYTNHAAAGLAWKIPLFKSKKFYTVLGGGLAIHDGRLHDPAPDETVPTGTDDDINRTAFSSRWLFNANVSLGYALTPRNAVELSWDHISNAGLNGQLNLGQDNVGIRFSHRF